MTKKSTSKLELPLIGIIMGSSSDYDTLKHAENILVEFNIAYEIQVVSAHRTPDLMYSYAKNAKEKGLKIIIAGAGGAAHLPGMVSALTTLPVLAVPVQTKTLNGVDSLLSIVQMPAGIPTATFAIGQAGATNAALFAIQILALHNEHISKQLIEFRHIKEQLALNSTQDLKNKKGSL
jgi:5-(carboxyamino)imidazole ribonucleotide mutase